MKKRMTFTSWWVMSMLAAALAFGQQERTQKINVPLTDPSRPAFLKIGLLSGGITVKGYAGKEVIVEATTHPEDEQEEDDDSAKRKGLKLIPNTSSGLTIEEDDNTVYVNNSGRWGSQKVDLNIQVPTRCSMKLSTVNEGDIVVTGVQGDLEVNNTNGSVTLNNIAGSVVAHALNGDVTVTLSEVSSDKPMSFTSLNGAIDVTFPSTLKASLQISDEQGQVYSDFDMQVDKSKPILEETTQKKGGKFRITLDKGIKGTINGGGQEIQFKNYNGNIYIRKGK